jgi:mannose-6-phosphate isomerase-like protein (cupin superfamily)
MKLLKMILYLTVLMALSMNAHSQDKPQPYILEHEKDIAKIEPGPHNGSGTTTAYSFFSKAIGLKMVFRKRVLHPGSCIGYHLQKVDEVYYIVSGSGEATMNGKTFPVKAGDNILTRPGSWHGLRQMGSHDLVIIIAYQTE